MLAFSRTVHDATHDSHLELLDPRILLTPDRHGGTQKIIDLFREFLEGGAGRTTAAGTGRNTGYKASEPQCLQDF